MRRFAILCLAGLVGASPLNAAELAPTGPLYPNSIVSNDLRFLTLDDPAVAYCLAGLGRAAKPMPNRNKADLMDANAIVYVAHYADGTSVEIWASSDFDSESLAAQEAEEIAKRLALFPTFMRETLRHVVLNSGNDTAYAEHLGHFFVVSSENMALRRTQDDMEETLFHETVHATLDAVLRDGDPDWASNQANDPGFVTQYARDVPSEDLAESAIFAFTDKYHVGRLPSDVMSRVREVMPGRLDYLQNILPEEQDYTVQIRDAKTCP